MALRSMTRRHLYRFRSDTRLSRLHAGRRAGRLHSWDSDTTACIRRQAPGDATSRVAPVRGHGRVEIRQAFPGARIRPPKELASVVACVYRLVVQVRHGSSGHGVTYGLFDKLVAVLVTHDPAVRTEMGVAFGNMAIVDAKQTARATVDRKPSVAVVGFDGDDRIAVRIESAAAFEPLQVHFHQCGSVVRLGRKRQPAQEAVHAPRARPEHHRFMVLFFVFARKTPKIEE